MRLGMGGLGFAGKSGDDVAAKGGAWFRVGGRIAVGTSGVGGETLLPVRTQSGVVEDVFGLCNRRCESIQCTLAFGGDRPLVGIADGISMGVAVAGAENDFVVAGEFARHGVERMRECGACHSC